MTDSPRSPSAWRRVAALGSLALGLLWLLAWAFVQGRPVPLPEVTEPSLPCVSYAPFRRAGHSPFDPALTLTPALIEADLRLIRTVSRCVRTYGVDQGMDAVPAIARQLGLRVILGAWIDSDSAGNATQLQRALALTHDYADVIDLLVVGNEVLLRGEQTPAALADMLAAARRGSRVPVTYADVWEFWRRHGDDLRHHVDVVTIHLLPYWEDTPVAVDRAVAHVFAVNAEMQAIFSPLPVLIGETGWPAAGRQRGAAIPGPLEQSRFIRELLTSEQMLPDKGQAMPLPAFNLIEAFDQPWKRRLEGAMGGYWGVFTADGEQRVTLRGPVVADPQWWQLPLAALGGACASLLWALARVGRQNYAALLGSALAAGGVALLTLLQWQELLQWNRTPLDWALGGGLALAALVSSLAAIGRLRAALAGRSNEADSAHWSTRLLLVLVLLSALGLLLDGRYRPLSWPVLAAPAALWLALRLLGEAAPGRPLSERWLAALCAVAAPLLLWQEGFDNRQALGLALNWLALAAVVGWPYQRATAAS
jgi:exo-beta-1,3-glucanase (GH17 family)